MLGPLEVRTDDGPGEVLEVAGSRLRALLTLLALRPGQLVPASQLIDGLWGDAAPAGAANALQALVSRLRRALPEAVIESRPAGYQLKLDPGATDIVRFEELAAAGQAQLDGDPAAAAAVLRQALALWRGPALVEVAGTDAGRAVAARLDELRLTALENRIDADLRRGVTAGLVAELEGLVVEHPTREPLAARLMRALQAAGRRGAALEVYEQIRERLADELGVDPSAGLAALHLELLRDEPPAPTAPWAPAGAPQTEASPRTNLRAELTSFVGRDDELAQVAGLLGAYRLVTLTGPGGAGKTRLAVEAARAELDAARGGPLDGVWLVELAPVSDPGEVPSAVLNALGLREQALIPAARPLTSWAAAEEQAADTLGRLVSALAGRRALLVLDNCEHLVAPAAALADRVLATCPQVRILATSREPLNITGEALWAVGPLTLPPAPAATDSTAERAAWHAPRNDSAGLADYASVRLFTQRAQAVFGGFEVTRANAPAVAGICRALDGMPLAIELAAARMRTMTPEQVAARLDDRFQLLSSGSRTAMPRHQTLRAVVDWSWELLGGAERTLWRRFSAFTGGATLEAAVQVCAGPAAASSASLGSRGPGADGLSADQVRDLVTALADKSLLTVRRGPDGVRYRMLEIIRAYGAERLEEAGEREALRQAHGRYFLQLAEESEEHLRAAEQLDWLRRLADDQDNLHTALRGAVAAGDARTAVGLAAALGWYWSLRSMKVEGGELMAEALGMPGADHLELGDSRDVERLGLAYMLGALLCIDTPLRDYAQAWFARAAGVAPRITDPVTPLMPLIAPLNALFGSFQAGHGMARPEVFDDAIADAHPWVSAMGRSLRAHTTLNLGQDHDQAEADFKAAAAMLRQLGERWAQSVALSGLAMLEGWRGEHAASVEHYRQAAEFTAALGSVEDEIHFRLFMARELWLLGERDQAWDELARAEGDAGRLGLPEVLALAAYTAGDLARLGGDAERARPALLRAVDLGASPDISQQIRATAATGLGYLAAEDGDLDAARGWHVQALETAMGASDAPVIANALIGFADLALREEDPEGAAELIGATSGIRGAPDRSALDEDRVTVQARAVLGDVSFATAHQRGQRVTLDTLAAWSRSHPALEGPHRQRREHDGETDRPEQ